ncbi:MAG TPA: prolipoprotein diacylglyceryl transferase [Vicinamibacterales bacterium]|nr:prolipoprotein diacylglyceryl transferase [Vicinamibacterales bacterium]
MVPVLFRIGSVEITSFGVMVALGALAGLWIFQRELRRARLPDAAVDAAIFGLFGGLAGAKLLYVAEHLGESAWLALLTDRGGMSWFGGFVGGVGVGLLTIWWRRWPTTAVLAAATPGLAFGQLLGRIGCFLVGDDYGRATDLPWGVAFPRGLPPTTEKVHPTQLYEAAFLGILGWLLIRWRRRGMSDRGVLGAYLLLAGVFRFLLEFVRVNVHVLGPLTVAQFFAAGVAVIGAVLLMRR